MKYLLLLVLAIGFVGCDRANHEYVQGDSYSTSTKIGIDSDNQPVYVREIVIKRGDFDYNKIFVRCTAKGEILSGTITTSYQQGKQHVDNTAILN